MLALVLRHCGVRNSTPIPQDYGYRFYEPSELRERLGPLWVPVKLECFFCGIA